VLPYVGEIVLLFGRRRLLPGNSVPKLSTVSVEVQ